MQLQEEGLDGGDLHVRATGGPLAPSPVPLRVLAAERIRGLHAAADTPLPGWLVELDTA
jgi:hypothetical protein